MKLLFQTLAKNRQPYGGFVLVFLLLALVLSVAGVVTTRLTGDMAQAALDFDTSALLGFFAVVTALMVIRAGSAALSALLLGRFAAKASYRFRENFVRYFLQKPFSAFEGANSGENLSVYSNDLPQAVLLVAGGGLRLIADVISLLVTFVYMLMLAPGLTLIFFASFPVLVVMQVLISTPIQSKAVKRSEAQATVIAVVNDSLQNTSTVASYSLEEVMERRINDSMAQLIAATKGYILSFTPLVMVGMLFSIAPLIVIMAVASHRVINGNLTFAEFIAFIGLASEAGNFLMMLSQNQNNFKTAQGGAQRLTEAVKDDAENISNGAILTPQGDIAVEATNLVFSYPVTDSAEEKRALDSVSFQIKKGGRVAFIGGSGSGKSTVLKLLLGLYTPTAGKLSVFGADVTTVSLESLRNTFAYVPQDSFLFPESIGANITGERTPSDPVRLTQACRDAGILDFIESLPQKFESVLNESAENISGGQKQRIALARAFYRDAPIILFDEATSALDPTTEAEILQSFNALAADKTVIMVAHRAQSVAFCDTIIEMDGGRI
ncbi:MAG: ABC transporter ATP-binding protein/permease [Defluviitaleaceae bacterium]|nr:ABC transporter ATP-binding protein/permease [Defluviitaleaceae bacterium]MCL2274013.1 ABC transporter ATP-binding protein/permease [Defluviitaleaceae bacterium]MCL2274086.1 ABC transporter ATP-binding protein/permease [Defluviitaleaceae bacterium]